MKVTYCGACDHHLKAGLAVSEGISLHIVVDDWHHRNEREHDEKFRHLPQECEEEVDTCAIHLQEGQADIGANLVVLVVAIRVIFFLDLRFLGVAFEQ